MKHQLLKLAYIRKRDRKSLLFVIAILLFSSFSDEIYLSVKGNTVGDDVGAIPSYIDTTMENITNASTAKIDLSPVATNRNLKYRDHNTNIVTKKVKPKTSVKYSFQSSRSSHSNGDHSIKPDSLSKLPRKPLVNLSSIKIDPDNPDIDQLQALGIPKKVAFTWTKYTQAGGKIQQKEDLEKIYGMEKEHVEILSKHMVFPQKLKFNPLSRLSSIYMNQATSYDYSKVPGIGPVLSERIVKFRDKLGGFHSVTQLTEVYGIEPELIEKHADLFLIEIPVEKININTCNEKQLGAHSYCSYRVAKAIINYRAQHGNFTASADLSKIRIVEEEWITKISPYLDF